MFLSDMNDPEAMQELKEEFQAAERGRYRKPTPKPRAEAPQPTEVFAEEPDR